MSHPTKKSSDRCINPFQKTSHVRKNGLRKASNAIVEVLTLKKTDMLCSTCRKEAENKVKEHFLKNRRGKE